MQNNRPPYQGNMPQGSFADHTYDNAMGPHCQQGGYQQYANGPYPISSPPPGHHYDNHHMHQGGGYRPNYAPVRNRYVPPPNQDMYRNHHRVPYGGNNDRRHYSGKPMWCDSNPSDIIPSYNHGMHHSQMMNTPPMNTSSIRPSHMNSDIHPSQQMGSQHYRPMPSPGQTSPQSWSHSQAPSPGIHNAARTTPSPLHLSSCSPHHSQQYPTPATHIPAASNVLSHTIPSVPNESPQPPLAQGANEAAIAGPLHSLQKMVMLGEENIVKLNREFPSDLCEPQSIHSSENASVANQNSGSDSKDSAYATYLNLDENRVESEPQSEVAQPMVFTPPLAEAVAITPDMLGNPTSIPADPQVPPLASTYKESEQTFNSLTTNCPSGLGLPMEAAESRSPKNVADTSNGIAENFTNAEISNVFNTNEDGNMKTTSDAEFVAEFCNSENSKNALQACFEAVLPDKSVESNNCVSLNENNNTKEIENSEKEDQKCAITSIPCKEELKPSEEDSKVEVLKKENSDLPTVKSPFDKEKGDNRPSIVKLTAVPVNPEGKVSVDIAHSKIEHAELGSETENEKHLKFDDTVDGQYSLGETKPNISQNSDSCTSEPSTTSKAVEQSIVTVKTETEVSEKPSCHASTTVISLDSNKKPISITVNPKDIHSEILHNPVKVVIHRIRTNNTNDTWHVPNSEEKFVPENQNKHKVSLADNGARSDTVKPVSKVGPQLIFLSPAMAKKRLARMTSNNPKLSSPAETGNVPVETSAKKVLNKHLGSNTNKGQGRKRLARNTSPPSSEGSSQKNLCNPVSPKKRGRPVGSQTKSKSPTVKRNCKGKKQNLKNKKLVGGDAEVVPKLKKLKPFAGPYVHIKGPKQTPSAITIVNVAIKEDEKTKKCVRVKSSSEGCTPKRPPVGHSSTLSPHYDAFNFDRTWLCIFCHKGSHCCGLGDLYGPYYVKDDRSQDSPHKKPQSISRKNSTSSSSNRSQRCKRRRSDASISEGKLSAKKAKQSTRNVVQMSSEEASKTPTKGGDSTGTPQREVWIHEDCAVWCQNISLHGSQVQGLEDAVYEAKENMCSHCKSNGAMLGCWWKSCKEMFHFACAKEKGCQLDFENFSLFCPLHKNMKAAGKQKRNS